MTQEREIDLQRFADFAPTPFDAKGHIRSEFADRRQWYLAPVSQTRDSGALDRSNFECCLRELGGESETVEVHRFGHWGPGWFEVILINPADDARVQIAQDIANGLADYPVVDETHFSELEWNEAAEYWERMSVRERVAYLQRADLCIFAARRNALPQDDNGRLYELLTRE